MRLKPIPAAVRVRASLAASRFRLGQVRFKIRWVHVGLLLALPLLHCQGPVRTDPVAAADASMHRAVTAFDQGRYGGVIAPARAALEAYAAAGQVAGQGRALHYLGQARRRLADYPEALALHRQALELGRRTADPMLQGQALIDLGDVHERQKDLKAAVGSYRDALEILGAPAHWQEAARAYRQLGDVQVATGDFQSAYDAYSQALQRAETARDFERIAEFNDYIGFCHRRLGDYPAAMAYHRRALENAALIMSADGRARAGARSLNHLGLCRAKLAETDAAQGKPEAAAQGYREAIALEEQALAQAAQARDRWRQGYILRALSGMHRERGALLEGPEAAREFQQALLWADEALSLGIAMQEKEWQGLALHDRALALALLGRAPEGLETLQRALALWEQIGDLQSAGYAHRFAARQFHEAGGRLAEAEAAYDQALRAFEKIGDVESQAATRMDQARLQALRGDTENAARLYDVGIVQLEAVRARAGLPEFRQAFMGKVYDRYEEAARFALGQGFDDQALRYVESMKARTFLDQLAEGRVELEKGIDPALKAQRDELERALSAAADTLAAEYRKPVPDPAVLDPAQVNMQRLGANLNDLKKQIRLRNPFYAGVQYPQPVALQTLQTEVLRPEEVLLEYFVTDREVFCFIVATDGFQAAKLTAGTADLRNRVTALLDNLNSGPARGEGYDRTSAAELYDLLLRPFEQALAGRTLVIVPDGFLALFPFEALVKAENGRRAYLFEKHAIKYVQSASVLTLLRTQHAAAPAGERFIGFGDPVYDYDHFQQGQPERDAALTGRGLAPERYAALGGRLSRLEASGEEVRAIERLFRAKSEGRTLLRDQAREEYAKAAAMAQYGYIHFSMHGIVTPGLQAIAFSQIPGSGEDGLLTMGEIMNLRFNARLVVLSACRTGLGAIERGEGITGLTRAVIYAGTPAAVVSLWSVDDSATRELMTRFYECMIGQGAGRSEALRRAKREIAQTRYRHPYFWAAFVMYGE